MTTVADFVSARYGKSQAVAAVAALIALIGSAPYVALQLKAVAPTVLMVVNSFDRARLTPDTPSASFYLAVSLLLAAFAMAFGTRRINPKEHQEGLILAIAVKSIVKLVAFLAVGAFVVWGLNDGIVDLTEVGAVRSQDRRSHPDAAGSRGLGVTTLLSAFAIVLLPRQFHVAIVENHDQRGIRTAAWLFPTYLVLINLFVAPLAIAGLKVFPSGSIDRDLTVLALPLNAGAHGHRADDHDRRPFRGDRNGGGGKHRARNHHFQRPRDAAAVAAARRAGAGGRGRHRRACAMGPPVRNRRRSGPRLRL